MLATKQIHPNSYLASVYFFLHFQYNGWFFFAGMGLLTQHLFELGTDDMKLKRVYLLFVTACIPAYFLSALWLPLPRWAYLLVVVAVFFQLAGWVMISGLVKKALPLIKSQMGLLPRRLFFLCGIALTIKLSLQAGSVIPSMSKLAFGFRPIVIGYLHLVLLGVVTLFILSYFLASGQNTISVMTRKGIILFTAAIIFNELLLMVQGIADLYYVSIPYINESLLIAALILFGGIFIINYGQWRLKEMRRG